MNAYELPQQRIAHQNSLDYQDQEKDPYVNSLFSWPRNEYFQIFMPDANLFNKYLPEKSETRYTGMANDIFGQQLKQQRFSLKHIGNLLYERTTLHQRHLNAINHSLFDLRSRRLCLDMGYQQDKTREKTALDKVVVSLEQERRNEDLAFWKDTAEMRKELFSDAGEYQAIANRFNLFADFEK